MKKSFDWSSDGILGLIPEFIAHAYHLVGNINEHDWIVAETTIDGSEISQSQDIVVILDHKPLILITIYNVQKLSMTLFKRLILMK